MPAKKDISKALITATMELATERNWHDVTLIDIATRAGVSIADCHDHCRSKADLLRQFVRRIDHDVLADLDPEDFKESGHDRLIAVIMARFDALAPYRYPLKSIIDVGGDLGPGDSLRAIKTHFGSMRWMLEAAGFQTGGLHGSLRVAGLGAIYARTFRHWLNDETTDFAPTMAYLDRTLSQGADWDKRMGKGLEKADGLCSRFAQKCRDLKSAKAETEAPEPGPGKPAAAGPDA